MKQKKNTEGGFLGMILYTLTTNLFGRSLAEKGVKRIAEGAIRSSRKFLIWHHHLTNLEIQEYY